MKKIYFDGEMKPELDKVVEFNKPYKEFEPLAEFDSTAVKLGKMVDQEKIDAKIQDAREKHAEAIEGHLDKHNAEKKEYWDALNDKAALNPETGRVLTIGTINFNDEIHVNPPEEKEEEVLKIFWSKFTDHHNSGAEFIGWNIFDFDLPYMVMRSRLLKVKVPVTAYSVKGGRWYWSDRFVDLMPLQGCGVYAKKYYALSKAAKFYGVEQDRDYDVTGKYFWKYWTSEKAADQVLGLQYLTDDLKECQAIDKAIRQF